MSLRHKRLHNFCNYVKMPNVVDMGGVEDYEPSYQGLKPFLPFWYCWLVSSLRTFLSGIETEHLEKSCAEYIIITNLPIRDWNSLALHNHLEFANYEPSYQGLKLVNEAALPKFLITNLPIRDWNREWWMWLRLPQMITNLPIRDWNDNFDAYSDRWQLRTFLSGIETFTIRDKTHNVTITNLPIRDWNSMEAATKIAKSITNLPA